MARSLKPRAFVLPVIALLAALLSNARTVDAETITVSAAASLKESLTEIAARFETATHDHVSFTFGGSGQLAAQISHGAPVDVFISAANKEADDLSHAGLIEEKSRRVIAGNQIVLIVPADSSIKLTGFEQLAQADVKKLAIGEPKTVPAGQYAMQILTALKLSDDLRGRLIFGSSVRQVLDYVERGEVSAGIVYATDARQAGQKVKIIATAKPDWHEAVVYPAMMIKNSGKKKQSAAFLDYLAGKEAAEILKAHGFSVPKAEDAGAK